MSNRLHSDAGDSHLFCLPPSHLSPHLLCLPMDPTHCMPGFLSSGPMPPFSAHTYRTLCNTSRGSDETVSSSSILKREKCFFKSPSGLPSCLLGQNWDICTSQNETLERGIISFMLGSGVSLPLVCVCKGIRQ